MKKPSSILIIFVIVIIAFFTGWKVGTPNLSSESKENTTEKVSKKESKKIKKKETSESESSSTETSSSVKSEVSNVSSSESTSSVQPNVKYPVLQKYAGKTYYAVNRESAEVPDMFPTSFTITSDTASITIDGKQELIRDVSSDSGFIALTGEMGHTMGTGLSFEFRPLGVNDDAVEVINQGKYLAYSTTISE